MCVCGGGGVKDGVVVVGAYAHFFFVDLNTFDGWYDFFNAFFFFPFVSWKKRIVR